MFNHMYGLCITNSDIVNITIRIIHLILLFLILVSIILLYILLVSLYLGCFDGYFWYFNFNLKEIMGILNFTEYL